jgi:hypothetical protein
MVMSDNHDSSNYSNILILSLEHSNKIFIKFKVYKIINYILKGSDAKWV